MTSNSGLFYKKLPVSDSHTIPIQLVLENSIALSQNPSSSHRPSQINISKSGYFASPLNSRSNSKMGQQFFHQALNNWHATNAAMDQLETVRRVLKIENRTPEEALVLYKYLAQSKFFKDFRVNHTELHETDALLHACQFMNYEQYPAGRVVFKEGDSPNGKMYMILTGEVNIVAKKIHSHSKNYSNYLSAKKTRSIHDLSSKGAKDKPLKKLQVIEVEKKDELLSPPKSLYMKSSKHDEIEMHRRNAIKRSSYNFFVKNGELMTLEDETLDEHGRDGNEENSQEKGNLHKKKSEKHWQSSHFNSHTKSTDHLDNEEPEESDYQKLQIAMEGC